MIKLTQKKGKINHGFYIILIGEHGNYNTNKLEGYQSLFYTTCIEKVFCIESDESNLVETYDIEPYDYKSYLSYKLAYIL